MDRRSFITSLIGGFAAASLGGISLATAAPSAVAADLTPDADAVLPAATGDALDQADAGYSQYYYRRRRRYYRRHYGYRRRYWRRPDRRARPNSQR